MPVGLIGRKLGQTSVYDSAGVLRPVTIVEAGPNRVLQIRTKSADGYTSVQLGFGRQKEHRLSKPMLGHLAKHKAINQQNLTEGGDRKLRDGIIGVLRIREFRDYSKSVSTGDLLGPGIFSVGDLVDVIGTSRGRGFEGVVGRHGFRGGDSTHGAKGWHRRSGAIGQRLFPGTVMRGMKMPGHTGHVSRTVQNLRIIQIRAKENMLLIHGAVPGANGAYVIIREAKKQPLERARKGSDLGNSRRMSEELGSQSKGRK